MTLDGVERDAHRRRPADLRRRRRADRHRRRHGRRSTPRSPTPPPTVALEMAWFDPVGDRRAPRPGSACAPRRRPASSGASTRTVIDRAVGPLRRAAARDLPGAGGARRARSTPAASLPAPARRSRVRTGAGQRAARHRARRATTSPRLLEPIGFTVPAATATCDVAVPVVAARLRRARSTSSRRSPATTATSRIGKTVPTSAVPGAPDAAPAATPAHLRQVLVGLGLGEAMPNPFLAPGDLARAGLAGDGIAHHQPARRRGERAAHVAAARAAAGGRLQRVAPQRRRRAVRDRPRLPPPGRRPAAARRARGARRRAGRRARRRPPWRLWRELADGARRRRRRASTSGRRCPGCTHPQRPLVAADGDRVGAVGEIDPGVLEALRHRRAGGRGSRSTSTALLARPPGRPAVPAGEPATRRATSTSPSCVADDVPAATLDGGAARGRRRPARRPRACSTSTAAPACPQVIAASPTGCGCRPPTARSPTPTSPPSASAAVAAAAVVGATLRA